MRYQVAILEVVVLLILSLPQHNRVKLFGSIAAFLFQRLADKLHLLTILALTPTIAEGVFGARAVRL